MKNVILTIALLSCISGLGCSVVDELLVLKQYGANQDEIEGYIKESEELFNKLVEDAKAGRIKLGISESEFVAIYGAPVIVQESANPKGKVVAVYRYPTYYFDTDKVYIYYDDDFRLSSCEYFPYIKSLNE